jgi:copper homeostasis protein
LVEFSAPLPVTFHRAFDETPDLFRALQDVISAGAARILTAGGAANALDALETLRMLVATADQRIVIMPGGGIRAENLACVRKATNAREFHSGLGGVLPYGSTEFARFEAGVRALAQQKTQRP